MSTKKDRDQIKEIHGFGGSFSSSTSSKKANGGFKHDHTQGRLTAALAKPSTLHAKGPSTVGSFLNPGQPIVRQFPSAATSLKRPPPRPSSPPKQKRPKVSPGGNEEVPASPDDCDGIEIQEDPSPSKLYKQPSWAAGGLAGPGPSSAAHRIRQLAESLVDYPDDDPLGEDPLDVLGPAVVPKNSKPQDIDPVLEGYESTLSSISASGHGRKTSFGSKPEATRRMHERQQHKKAPSNAGLAPFHFPPSSVIPANMPPPADPPPGRKLSKSDRSIGSTVEAPITIDDSVEDEPPEQNGSSHAPHVDDPIQDSQDEPRSKLKPPPVLSRHIRPKSMWSPPPVAKGTVQSRVDFYDGTSPSIPPSTNKPVKILPGCSTTAPSVTQSRSTGPGMSQPATQSQKLSKSMNRKNAAVPLNTVTPEVKIPKLSKLPPLQGSKFGYRLLPLKQWYLDSERHGPWKEDQFKTAERWIKWSVNTLSLCTPDNLDPGKPGKGVQLAVHLGDIGEWETTSPQCEPVVMKLTLPTSKKPPEPESRTLVLHFDNTAGEDWSENAFRNLGTDIFGRTRSKAKRRNIDPNAARGILEIAERWAVPPDPPPNPDQKQLPADDEYEVGQPYEDPPSEVVKRRGPQEDSDGVGQPRRSRRQAQAKIDAITFPNINDTEFLFTYPPVNITRGELARLEPDEFLNDTLIEFGLKLWMDDLWRENRALAEQIWVFNSFFYKKLNVKKVEQGYLNVKKWTMKVDIFKKKFIVVPINENLHWYLAVIYEPQYSLEPPFPPEPPAKASRSSARKATAERASSNPPDVDAVSTVDSEAAERLEVNRLLEDGPAQVLVSATPPEEVDDDGDIKMSSHSSGPSTPKAEPKDDGLMDEVNSLKELSLEAKTADRGPSEASGILTNGDTSAAPANGRLAPDEVIDPEVEEQPNSDIVEQSAADAIARHQDQKTHIFVMDSLGGRHPHVSKVLKQWIKLEAADKREISEIRQVDGHNVKVPYQPNHVDCGVYLLQFAESFIKRADDIKRLTMTKGLNDAKIRDEIFDKEALRKKRRALKERAEALAEEWKKDHPLPLGQATITASGSSEIVAEEPPPTNGDRTSTPSSKRTDDERSTGTVTDSERNREESRPKPAAVPTAEEDSDDEVQFVGMKEAPPPPRSGRKPAKGRAELRPPTSNAKSSKSKVDNTPSKTATHEPLRLRGNDKRQ